MGQVIASLMDKMLYQAPPTERAAIDWRASGMEAVSPHAKPTCNLPGCANLALERLRTLSGREVLRGLHGGRLLTERARHRKMTGSGHVSANGHCYLFPTQDAMVAINLARDDDWQLLPAWLEDEQIRRCHPDATGIRRLSQAVAEKSAENLLTRGIELGLALAIPGETPAPAHWCRFAERSLALPLRRTPRLCVVDLSSLWAGPLAAHLLHLAGGDIIKVESSGRPDAMRAGDPWFFDLLNAGKRSVALNLRHPEDQKLLLTLIRHADIVIESARPRALVQLGIDSDAILAQRPGLIWLRITGHGSDDDHALRVGFGDDAAIAGGAYLGTANQPRFLGDAIADPLTGIHAALAAFSLWCEGVGGLLDISLSQTSAWCVRHAALPLPLAQADHDIELPLRHSDEHVSPIGTDTAAIAAALARHDEWPR